MQSRTAAISRMYSSVAVFCHSNVESEEEIVSMQHSPQLSIPTDPTIVCRCFSAKCMCIVCADSVEANDDDNVRIAGHTAWRALGSTQLKCMEPAHASANALKSISCPCVYRQHE